MVFEWYFLVIITRVCTNYSNTLIIVCTNYYFVSKPFYKLCFQSFVNNVLKERKNVITSRERKIRISVFLYDVKVKSNHGIRLKTRMSHFIRPPLFLCCGNVNLNYCAGIKEKWPKTLIEIRVKIPKLKSFNMKTNFRCYTNYIWKFFVNVK